MKKLTMICAIIISAAGITNAAPTITFDEFPLGTLIDNQYAPQGVLFLPGIMTPRLPQISMNGAMPMQPVLRPTGEPDYFVFKGDFWMQFIYPVQEVHFMSGYWNDLGAGIIGVYDPAMNFLANLTNTVDTSTGGIETINISGLGPVGYIYFNSIADPFGADIDNLSFRPIPAPGALLLGSMGVGLVSWLRRRQTL